MSRIILVLIAINALSAFILLTRIAFTKGYLKKPFNLYEWLFSIFSIMLAIGALDIYLLVTNFYSETRLFNFLLSYPLMLLGPLVYAIVHKLPLKKLMKMPVVFGPFLLYVIVANGTLYLLTREKFAPADIGMVYYLPTIYTFFFTLITLIRLVRGGKNIPFFHIKLCFCLLFLLHGIASVLRLGIYYFLFHLIINFIGLFFLSIYPLIKTSLKKEVRPPLDNQDAIITRFKMIMDEEEGFLDPQCRLETMAQKIGVRRDQLSHAVNSAFKMRFTDVINQYRIEYSLDLLKTADNILEVAFDSGFSSKSSFYNYFKRMIGQTPRDYIKNVQAYK